MLASLELFSKFHLEANLEVDRFFIILQLLFSRAVILHGLGKQIVKIWIDYPERRC